MSSISSGSCSGVAVIASECTPRAAQAGRPGRACYRWPVCPASRRETRPAAAGRAPRPSCCPSWGRSPPSSTPSELLPAIARQLRRHRRLPHPRHLPARGGRHPGPRLRGGLRRRGARRASGSGPGEGIVGAAAGHARGRLRARRQRRTRATSPSCPGVRGGARHPARPPRPAGGRAQHRGPRRRGLHPGGAHGAAGAGQPPRGGHRERDPLPRDALVRGPAGHALRDRQGDRLHPRPRRAAAAAWPRW